MSPAVLSYIAPIQRRLPNPVLDRIFFSSMILVLWATVLIGFGRTYFFAGMAHAPLPNRLIHLHGAAFTLWMVLLLVQTSLITTRKIRVHRTLGLFGFGLAVLMVALGLTAAVDMLRRNVAPPPNDPRIFFMIPLSGILLFATLIYASYRNRTRPELHKRLILLGTIEIMGAAVGRFPTHFFQSNPVHGEFVMLSFVLLVVAFDLVSLRRISKSTLWASALIIVVHLVRMPIASTPLWIAFAGHVRGY